MLLLLEKAVFPRLSWNHCETETCTNKGSAPKLGPQEPCGYEGDAPSKSHKLSHWRQMPAPVARESEVFQEGHGTPWWKGPLHRLAPLPVTFDHQSTPVSAAVPIASR